MEPRKYDFVQVTLEPEDYEKVREVYRLHKEQASKIFDLSSGVNTDEDIMDVIQNDIENNIVILAIDTTNGRYAGAITFDTTYIFDGVIVSTNVHIVVCKKYWGKESRKIIYDCYEWLNKNMKPLMRVEAFVPSNNFGIIKLLKDVGFKIEGTLKNRVVYNNKKGIPTYYNQLVYSNTNIYKGMINGQKG